MLKPMHTAITAGLALTLGLGAAALPAQAAAEPAAAQDAASDAQANLPEPSSYDKEEFYQEGAEASAASGASRARISLVSVSEDMKYFAQYESSCNYNQGFSAGDGYNALGYYQFDRRYGLVDFMQMCYDYNPGTYSMFAPVIARGSEVKTGTIYNADTRSLTELGQLVEDAWHAAFKANAQEFSALQDTWAYNQYYLPAEQYLASRGIDIADRSDCVKGLCWGLSNLFGTTGWHLFVGGYASGYDWNGTWNSWREWPGAGLSNTMTDREFVETLCNYVVDNVSVFYKAQPQYHRGWKNRYLIERNQCISMLALAGTSDNIPGAANAGNDTGTADDDKQNDAVDGTENDNAADTTPAEPEVDQDQTQDAGDKDEDAATDTSADNADDTNGNAGDTGAAGTVDGADQEDGAANDGSALPPSADNGLPVDSDQEAADDSADAPAADTEIDTDNAPGTEADNTQDGNAEEGEKDSSDNTADDANQSEDSVTSADDNDPAGNADEDESNGAANGSDTTDGADNADGNTDDSANSNTATDPEALTTHEPADPTATKTPGNPAPSTAAPTDSDANVNTPAQKQNDPAQTADKNAAATPGNSALPETSDSAAVLTYATAALTLAGAGFTVASKKVSQLGEKDEDR